LNPIDLTGNKIRISLGLSKRMEIPYDAIIRIDQGEQASGYNLSEKGAIQFIARDFEESKPQFILHFKQPLHATLFLGREKCFTSAAIRVDEPERFIFSLKEKLDVAGL